MPEPKPFEISRVLNAPRELVYKVHTEPGHLARWHLYRWVIAGRDIPYDAAAGKADLDKAYNAWKRLNSGERLTGLSGMEAGLGFLLRRNQCVDGARESHEPLQPVDLFDEHRDCASGGPHDQNVQLASAAERLPPGSHPLVRQERMRDAAPIDYVIPFALELRKAERVGHDVDSEVVSDRRPEPDIR